MCEWLLIVLKNDGDIRLRYCEMICLEFTVQVPYIQNHVQKISGNNFCITGSKKFDVAQDFISINLY
jgi:hypothetical protein